MQTLNLSEETLTDLLFAVEVYDEKQSWVSEAQIELASEMQRLKKLGLWKNG